MKTGIRSAAPLLLGAVLLTAFGSGPAYADVPYDQPFDGTATYYNDAGYGSCGTQIDASTQLLVAVPAAWWTAANPNQDPLCNGVSVQVSYNGTTITVPVADKCPTCDQYHIDLSQPAFEQLGDTNLGTINVSWQFVQSSGSGFSATSALGRK